MIWSHSHHERWATIVTTLALGLRPTQGGCKVVGQEKDSGVTSHALESAKSVRAWTLTLPRELPCSSECDCRGQNPSPWKKIYIIEKLLKCRCLKWARIAHFEHLKHKLWPKERSGVKLVVWLPTTKSRESTRFPCVQATCDIPLKSSRRKLQLCLRPHCDRRFAHEIMRPQSCRSPNCWNFETLTWESQDKKII
jgi:hypothetical protein